MIIETEDGTRLELPDGSNDAQIDEVLTHFKANAPKLSLAQTPAEAAGQPIQGPPIPPVDPTAEHDDELFSNATGAGRFANNFGKSAQDNFHLFGAGVFQKLDDLTGHNLLNDKMRENIKKNVSYLNERQNARHGTAATLGSVLADPTLAIPGTGLVKTGAKIGAISGFLAPSTEDSTLGGDLINAAVGGAGGAAAGKAMGVAGNAVRGVADRAITAFGRNPSEATSVAGSAVNALLSPLSSPAAADRIAYRTAAQNQTRAGLGAKDLAESYANKDASELGLTLGEMTGSRAQMSAEKSVTRRNDKAGQQAQDYLEERGSKTIPASIMARAEALRGGPQGAATREAAYAASKAEGGVNIQPATVNSVYTAGGTQTLDPKVDTLLTGLENEVASRLVRAGTVKNSETAALSNAQNVINTIRSNGGDYESLLAAKKQLGDILGDVTADAGVRRQANAQVIGLKDQVAGFLENTAAPTYYPKANAMGSREIAGRDLEQAYMGTTEGGRGDVKKMLDQVAGSPADREDFLRKILDDTSNPDVAAQTEIGNWLDGLRTAAEGHGAQAPGAGADVNAARDAAGVDKRWSGVLTAGNAIYDKATSLYAPKIQEANWRVATNPDIGRLSKAITSPDGALLQLAKKSAASGAGEGLTTPTDRRKYPQTIEGQDPRFSPVVNTILQSLGFN